MWGVTPSGKYDWDKLRTSIKEHGIRNSLMVAPMPTASTSQILETMNVSNHSLVIFIFVEPLPENL